MQRAKLKPTVVVPPGIAAGQVEPTPIVTAVLADVSRQQRAPMALMNLQRMQIEAFNSLAQATIGAAERLWVLNLSAGRLMIDHGAKAASHLLRSRSPEASVGPIDTGAGSPASTPKAVAAAGLADSAAPPATTSPRRSPAGASSKPTKPRPRHAVKPVQGTIRNKRKPG